MWALGGNLKEKPRVVMDLALCSAEEAGDNFSKL
jgi:hypothetical protein